MFNKVFLSRFSENISDFFLQKLLDRNVLNTFLYHVVSDRELPYIKHLYNYKTKVQFEKDIDILLKYYTPFDLSNGFGNINVKSRRPYMLLTFDDGLRECYDIIAPILKGKGIPAIFFVNTGFIDNKSLFYRFKVSLIIDKIKRDFTHHLKELGDKDLYQSIIYLKSLNYNDIGIIDSILKQLSICTNDFLREYQPYMSREQIFELKKMGFYVGAHSIDHPHFKDISSIEQIRQVKESMRFMKEEFNLDHKYFAFPFSEQGVSDQVYDLATEEEAIIDAFFGTSGFNKKNHLSKNLQQRVTLEQNKSVKAILTRSSLADIVKSKFRFLDH